MTTPNRKYLSEFSVLLCSGRWLMIQPSQLSSGLPMNEEHRLVSESCHIYTICSRPALRFEIDDFSYTDSRIVGSIVYFSEGAAKKLSFDIPNHLLREGARRLRISPYPHREIEALSDEGEIVLHLPASYLSLGINSESDALRQFEVLYVGQAYADGKRSAIDRLKKHDTLQKILADVNQTNPDDEILILAFQYPEYRILGSFDGISKTGIKGQKDSDRFISIQDNPLSKHQQICLVEAGLIRYFQPKYNKIYKTRFPASDQKILDECNRLDFSGLVVEINTDDHPILLFSSSVSPKAHHIARFDLIDPDQRRSFFTFVDRRGVSVSMPGVISPSKK